MRTEEVRRFSERNRRGETIYKRWVLGYIGKAINVAEIDKNKSDNGPGPLVQSFPLKVEYVTFTSPSPRVSITISFPLMIVFKF